MSVAFAVTERQLGELKVIEVSGELDVATAPILRDQLRSTLSTGSERVVVDLSDVSFLDSSALGVLVGALKRAREGGGRLGLVVVDPKIYRVFEITGLTEVFSITSALEDARTP